MKTALITGVLGQDGTYLAEHLLSLGYRVYGLTRREIGHWTWGKQWLEQSEAAKQVSFLYGDVRDELSLRVAIQKSQPDEIYNLAGQVFVPTSWQQSAETFDVNVGGLARIFKIVEDLKMDKVRIYQASSSEMFGNFDGASNETSPMNPTSPYGISKLAAHRLVGIYRKKGLFAVSGILFNHESSRRGPEMVTRKISMAVAAWSLGDTGTLRLGDLYARRDWGYAGEYVQAMHLMLQQSEPQDFVVGTEVTNSVMGFLRACAEHASINPSFVEQHVVSDKSLMREGEITTMRSDNSKIRLVLKWEPKVNLKQLTQLMVDADIALLRRTTKKKAAV